MEYLYYENLRIKTWENFEKRKKIPLILRFCLYKKCSGKKKKKNWFFPLPNWKVSMNFSNHNKEFKITQKLCTPRGSVFRKTLRNYFEVKTREEEEKSRGPTARPFVSDPTRWLKKVFRRWPIDFPPVWLDKMPNHAIFSTLPFSFFQITPRGVFSKFQVKQRRLLFFSGLIKIVWD